MKQSSQTRIEVSGTSTPESENNVSPFITANCAETGPEATPLSNVNEVKLRWKIDLVILSLLASVFFLATLGSSNLGNAKEAGMNEDLHLSPRMYSTISSLFLVGFILGQLPGTLLLRQLLPHRQFAGALLMWGLFTLGAAFSKSYSAILVCRLFIGFAEALVQGGVLYLSFWYDYTELATRAAVLSGVNALAGGFSGLAAYSIQEHLNGRYGLSAWRWIFLIEGILPMGWSLVVFIFLPPAPNNVRHGFTKSEKALLIQRAARSHNTGENKIKPRLILRVLLDPQWWLLISIQSCMFLCSSTTSNFLPAIMAGLGYSGVRSQLMSVIPYAVLFVNILVVSRLSDRTQVRGPWIIACLVEAGIGYILLLKSTSLTARLIATCLIAAGASSPAVICFAWIASANVGYTYRSSAVGMMNIVVNVVAIGGQQAFTDPPLYQKGLVVCFVMICVAVVLTVVAMVYFRSRNAKKRREQVSEEAEMLRGYSVDEIGNKHPDVFFTY